MFSLAADRVKFHIKIRTSGTIEQPFFLCVLHYSFACQQARLFRRLTLSHVFDYHDAAAVRKVRFAGPGGTGGADHIVHIAASTDNG